MKKNLKKAKNAGAFGAAPEVSRLWSLITFWVVRLFLWGYVFA